ncbi:MAG: ribosomal RNA small subunit methyltransferase A [Chloroflexi bacterium]|nr:ribosomal RNA small subunit methyltransferase A [Chloroflexota bacterium]
MPRFTSPEHSPKRPGGQHTPRKRFGQHFLRDRNILDKLVRAAEIQPSDTVLEIGPGRGDLTRALSETGAQVVAVEVDRDLAARLPEELSAPNVKILQGDILSQSPEAWLAEAQCRPPYLVAANLPYYITSAILRYLLEAPTPPTRLVVMVQREVAQQMTAQPPHSNLLAVSVQFYGAPRVVEVVPAGAFYPPPKVDSAIVHIQTHSAQPAIAPQLFFQVARAGFGTKRKQLRNALANGLHLSREEAERLLARAQVDPARRAETLNLAEWAQLARGFEQSRLP